MTQIVKLRGLERNTSQKVSRAATGTKILPGSGFRVKHGLLSPTRSGGSVTKGTLVTGSGATNQITWTPVPGGSVSSNIKIQVAAASGTAGTATFAVGSDTTPAVTIVATPGTGTTAAQLASLANADANVSQYVTAAPTDGTGAGSTLTNALTALSAGVNTGATSTEPFYVYVSGAPNQHVLVDIDDSLTLRSLYRNKGRFISLGTQP